MEKHINYTDSNKLRFVKLTADGKAPERGSTYAAGFDLFSAKTMVIPPQGRGLEETDIAMMLPEGTYGQIAPRSEMAIKHFTDVGGGVIDFDFTGNVGVILFNHGVEPFKIDKGDKIAQLIVEKIAQPVLVEALRVKRTERGANGFGLTGI